jgi:hypothetical protein
MTRRRWVFLVAAIASTVALGFGVGGIVSAIHTTLRPAPSPAALSAIESLEQVSHPVAFAGDQRIGENRWARATKCAALRTAYHAAGAPVPAGSKLTDDRFGNIVVDSPYGTSVVMFEEHLTPPRCIYSVERTATVHVEVPGHSISDQFTPVGCSNIFGIDIDPASLLVDGVEWSAIVVAPSSDKSWKALVAPGSTKKVLALTSAPPGGIEASGTATVVGDTIAFTGTGDAGPVAITISCTPDTAIVVNE